MNILPHANEKPVSSDSFKICSPQIRRSFPIKPLSVKQGEDFSGGASVKEPTCQGSRCKRGGFDPWVEEDPLEEGMATHSYILAWRIPWTEKPGGLQSIGPERDD